MSEFVTAHPVEFIGHQDSRDSTNTFATEANMECLNFDASLSLLHAWLFLPVHCDAGLGCYGAQGFHAVPDDSKTSQGGLRQILPLDSSEMLFIAEFLFKKFRCRRVLFLQFTDTNSEDFREP
eukprot:s4602_g3.t1